MSDIVITTSKGIEIMDIRTVARWACLIEAMEIIDETAEKNKINLDKCDWVKPIAIQKYINERYHAMLHDVKIQFEIE